MEKLDEAKRQLRELENFDTTEHGVLDSSSSIVNGRQTFSGLDKTSCRKKSFWMASEAPTSAPTAKEDVIDLTVRCPMSGKRLRMKELYPVEFYVAKEEAIVKGGERGMYACEVSKRPITVQQAFYIKPSRKVVTEAVMKTLIKPTMTCPISSKKLKESDIIKLKTEGTGFCAHNDVVSKRHCQIVSQRQNLMERRSGMLGCKGTMH